MGWRGGQWSALGDIFQPPPMEECPGGLVGRCVVWGRDWLAHPARQARQHALEGGSMPWRAAACPGGRQHALEGGSMPWRAAACPGGRQHALEGGSMPWRAAACPGGRQHALEGGSMPWRAAACPGGRQHALEGGSMPWRVAVGVLKIVSYLCRGDVRCGELGVKIVTVCSVSWWMSLQRDVFLK